MLRDLIDRSVAKKLFNLICEDVDEKQHAFWILDRVPPVDEEWFSVEDTLPKIGHRVLVYTTFDGVKVASLRKSRFYNESTKAYADWSAYTHDITHWRPLPEPPKDGVK